MTFFIGTNCVGCGGCRSRCPVGCISMGSRPFVIDQSRCIHCGSCRLACPIRAITIRR